jgi:hypothetical protein
MSLEKFYTLGDVAAFLGVSRMTLNRWAKKVPIEINRLGYPVVYPTKEVVRKWFDKLMDHYRPRQFWDIQRRIGLRP